jgi:MoxR-like ATPase
MTKKDKNGDQPETSQNPFSGPFIDAQGFIPKIRKAIELRHNIALRGKTGTGKTFLVRLLARESEKQLVTLNMTVNTSVDEIKGRFVVHPMPDGRIGVKWIDSQLVKAMREGHWVVIEEANFMRDEVASVLYSIMDDRREVILDEHEGEVIKAHPDFRIFLTMNWDYSGTQRFNPAIMNRINSWFDMEYLSAAAEAELLRERTGIEVETARKMTMFAQKVRKATEQMALSDLSTRILIDWARMVRAGIEVQEAAELSVIPILGHTEEEKDAPREFLNQIFSKKKFEEKE